MRYLIEIVDGQRFYRDPNTVEAIVIVRIWERPYNVSRWPTAAESRKPYIQLAGTDHANAVQQVTNWFARGCPSAEDLKKLPNLAELDPGFFGENASPDLFKDGNET